MSTRVPIPDSILQRKGARTTAEVPAEVRRLLNQGLLESANLCEWLVIDQLVLAENVLPQLGWSKLLPPIRAGLAALKTPTAPKRTELVGRTLALAFPEARSFHRAVQTLRASRSDVVRSWAAYMVGLRPGLTLADKLEHLRPLAADPNMGVREMAWFAVRESIAADLPLALDLLAAFARDPDPNLRRFASEATRPRGVWCRHLTALKANPSPGLVLLDPLKSDPSLYVRNSVANWLNDASKSCPDWVRSVCRRWEQESPTRETAYIVRRALRTLNKSVPLGLR